MKYPNNRRSNTTVPGSAPSMSLDDHLLVTKILELPIGDKFRADLTVLVEKLVPGKYGQMKTKTRDALVKFAKQHGAIQPPKRRAPRLHAYCDHYDECENQGTKIAEAIVAWQNPHAGGVMPVPPPMRKAQ